MRRQSISEGEAPVMLITNRPRRLEILPYDPFGYRSSTYNLEVYGPTGQAGSVYRIHNGSFGSFKNVIIKVGDRVNNREIIKNDVHMMQLLDQSGWTQRLYHSEYNSEHLFLAVEEYETNCFELLTHHQADLQQFKKKEIIRGAFQGLEYLHARSIMHRAIRAKHIAVRKIGGKLFD